MIFNEHVAHVAPGELVVHVTYHVTIDMSVNHVSFSLRQISKSRPQPPFQKALVEGQTQSLGMTSNAVPHSYKKFVRVVNGKSLNMYILFGVRIALFKGNLIEVSWRFYLEV